MRYEGWQDRLASLTNPRLSLEDPFYKVQLELFSHWLRATEMAMEDEHLSPVVIHHVMNRLLYAAPNGADAHYRQHTDQVIRDLIDPGLTVTPSLQEQIQASKER